METVELAEIEPGIWCVTLNRAAVGGGLRQAMELENRTQVLGYFTGNMEEAMQAFSEGRAPEWKRL